MAHLAPQVHARDFLADVPQLFRDDQAHIIVDRALFRREQRTRWTACRWCRKARQLRKPLLRIGVPEKITIDGSAANKAAIERYNEEHGTTITIRPITYRNNSVEQDHRAVKRVTRPMLECKSFHAARRPLVGIERMHMLKKNQLGVGAGDEGRTAVALFYSLAA